MSRFAELKRRNVFRVAALYLVASWLILQVADLLFDRLGVPGSAFRLVLGLLALGFPLALIFSWIYELTPEGLKFQHDVDLQRNVAPDAVRRLDVVTIALLIIAIAAVLADRLLPERATVAPRPAAQTAAAPDLSIAVLPFADLSPGKDQGYFSDGLTEELINLLAKVPQLKVTSRTSAFSLSGQNLDIRTVAKKLNVGHVLEGSVRKSGDRVRINAQLIDARNDVELWSETYERTLDDIFAVQEEIAAAAIAALTPTLVATDKPRAPRTDPNAYVAYLRARQLIEQGTVESRAQAVELLLAALAEQPKHAPSWTELGRAYLNQAIFREVPIRFGIEQARAALDRALRVEHGFAPAQAWMGILLEMEWDFAGARQRIQQALLSAPTDELVLRAARHFLQATGRPAQATEIDRWQLVRDPLNPAVYRRLGWDLAQVGRYQEAEEVIRRGGRLNPEAARLHADLGSIRLARGDPQGALQEFELEPNEARRQLGRAMAYHGLDRSAESLAIVRAVADAHPSFAVTVAEVYAYRGERDEAFQWLQRALELHDPDIVSLRASLMLMPLQDDARWSEVLERANLSDAQVAPLTLEVKLP